MRFYGANESYGANQMPRGFGVSLRFECVTINKHTKLSVEMIRHLTFSENFIIFILFVSLFLLSNE